MNLTVLTEQIDPKTEVLLLKDAISATLQCTITTSLHPSKGELQLVLTF